jgi:hypothetical protein
MSSADRVVSLKRVVSFLDRRVATGGILPDRILDKAQSKVEMEELERGNLHSCSFRADASHGMARQRQKPLGLT